MDGIKLKLRAARTADCRPSIRVRLGGSLRYANVRQGLSLIRTLSCGLHLAVDSEEFDLAVSLHQQVSAG